MSLLGITDIEQILPDTAEHIERLQSRDFLRSVLSVSDEKSSLASDVDQLSKHLNIKEKGRATGLIEITLEGPGFKENAQLLSRLLTIYQHYSPSNLGSQIKDTITVLQKSLKDVELKLQASSDESLHQNQESAFIAQHNLRAETLSRISLLSQALEKTSSTVSVLNAPTADDTPIKPKPLLVVVLSVMLGGMVGVGIVFLQEMLRKGFRTAEELEAKTGLVVLGAISNKDVESFRKLRTNLFYHLGRAANNRVIVSSPASTALNQQLLSKLARVCADAGKKTLLIDADLKEGLLSNFFDAQSHTSISDAVFGNKAPIMITENLDLIAGQQNLEYSSEMLMNDRFQALLEKYSTQYDLILISAPPILTDAEAVITGSYCETNLLLVEESDTTSKEVEESKQYLGKAGVKLTGIVFSILSDTA